MERQEEKEDLRIQKTYNALVSALKELLSEKSFEELTVIELCKRAQTRTATFYSHFSDKYDFFVFAVRRMRKQYILESRLDSDDVSPEVYFGAVIDSCLEFIRTNEAMLNSIEASSILATTMSMVSGEMHKDITQRLCSFERQGYVLSSDPGLLSELLIGAMSQIGRWWFNQRQSTGQDELKYKLLAVIMRMCFIS